MATREDALSAARALVARLEQPYDMPQHDADLVESMALDALNFLSDGPNTEYAASFYGGVSEAKPDEIEAFDEMIERLCPPGGTVLDEGDV